MKVNYELVHQTFGRFRLRIPRLFVDVDYGRRAKYLIKKLAPITQVRINQSAACLIIKYDIYANNQGLLKQIIDQVQAADDENLQAALKIESQPELVLDYLKNIAQEKVLERLGLPVVTIISAIALSLTPELVPAFIVTGLVIAATFPGFRKAIDELIEHRQFSANLLESVWTVAHTLHGELLAPALAIGITESGEILRDMTSRSEQKQRKNLLDNSRSYWVERGGEKHQLLAQELEEKDVVIVCVGDAVPADGIILKGTALIDQNYVTGDSKLITRGEGERVYAASLLVKGQLFVLVEETGEDTKAGKAIGLVDAAPMQDTRIGNYAEEISNQAILPSMVVGGLIFAFTADPVRAIAPLQLDFGAGIALTVPTTILSALTHAASAGVYIRSGRVLELLAQVDTVVFDKTGTLTRNTSKVVGIEIVEPDVEEGEFLSLAASPGHYLTHPISEAIVDYALEKGVQIQECQEWDYHLGMGIKATIQGQRILVGNSRFLEDHGIPSDLNYVRSQTGVLRNRSIIYVARGDRLLGLVFYSNSLRPESAEVIASLKKMGVETYMLTGDNHRVANAIAYKVGIRLVDTYTDAVPEKKIEILEQMRSRGHIVAYVGEGINDSPALAHADVSISPGIASDTARQVSDVILLDNDLRSLLRGISIAKQTMTVVHQNIALVAIPNVSIVLAGVFLSLNPVVAVAINNGAMILAELNALLLLWQEIEEHPDLSTTAGRSEEGLLDVPWQKRPKQSFAKLN